MIALLGEGGVKVYSDLLIAQVSRGSSGTPVARQAISELGGGGRQVGRQAPGDPEVIYMPP